MNQKPFSKKCWLATSVALALLTVSPQPIQAALGTTTPASTAAPATNTSQNQRRERFRHFLLTKFDTNRNGKLDPTELEALKKWIEDRRAKRGQKP